MKLKYGKWNSGYQFHTKIRYTNSDFWKRASVPKAKFVWDGVVKNNRSNFMRYWLPPAVRPCE